MTPQILLDALRKAFVSLEKVRLLIFDECHHATGNHPYTKIMKVDNFCLQELFHCLCCNSSYITFTFIFFTQIHIWVWFSLYMV